MKARSAHAKSGTIGMIQAILRRMPQTRSVTVPSTILEHARAPIYPAELLALETHLLAGRRFRDRMLIVVVTNVGCPPFPLLEFGYDV